MPKRPTQNLTIVTIALAALVVGCTAETAPSSGSGTFQGPWASEFETAYSATTSDLAKSILVDEVITDAEASEITTVFTSCLTGLGLSDVQIGTLGEVSYAYPPNADAATQETLTTQATQCETDTGWSPVYPLYVQVRVNPQKVDLSQASADCLVRIGARPAGYSADDLQRDDFADLPAPTAPEYGAWIGCLQDPLHSGG